MQQILGLFLLVLANISITGSEQFLMRRLNHISPESPHPVPTIHYVVVGNPVDNTISHIVKLRKDGKGSIFQGELDNDDEGLLQQCRKAALESEDIVQAQQVVKTILETSGTDGEKITVKFQPIIPDNKPFTTSSSESDEFEMKRKRR